MWRRGAAWALTLGAVALAAAAAGDQGPARKRVYSTDLPDGAGRAVIESGCLICHSAMLITQQHKDSTAWEKSVRQMEAWGAPVPPAEHAPLIGYLTEHFGPRKEPQK